MNNRSKVLLKKVYYWENSHDIEEDVRYEVEKFVDEESEFSGTLVVTVEYIDD